MSEAGVTSDKLRGEAEVLSEPSMIFDPGTIQYYRTSKIKKAKPPSNPAEG